MSMTLTFADAAWATARGHAVAGRNGRALAALAPLLGGADVPPRLRLLAHRLAARLHHAAGRYKPARRELRLAEHLDPTNAEIHYEIGQALEQDPDGCDRRAVRRFRRAVSLSPRQARFIAAFGRALVRVNKVKSGVAALRSAARLAPADAAVLRVVMDGLFDADKPGEAVATVMLARFSAAGDKAVTKLVADSKFRLAAGPARGPKHRPRPTLKIAGVRSDAGHAPRGPRFARPDVFRV